MDCDYHDLLRTAARDFVDRGWTPVPVSYKHNQLVLPTGWQKLQPECTWPDHEFDAIGVMIASTELHWLDLDSKEAIANVSRLLKRNCPYYTTKRGRQYLVRLNKPIAKTIDLRKIGIEGEIRAGKCLSIMPPSKHITGKSKYKWRSDLPESDSEIPAMTIRDVFKAGVPYWELFPKKISNREYNANLDTLKGTVVSSSAESIQKAIDASMPTAKGRRQECLPVFIRLLMSIRTDYSEKEIEELAMQWWRTARGRNLTNDRKGRETVAAVKWLFGSYDADRRTFRAQTIDTMQSIPKITEAAELCSRNSQKEQVVKLATLCRAMYIVNGGPFFLSCRDAAKAIGTTPQTANNMLKLLARPSAGFIQIVKEGTTGVPFGGKARVLRWCYDNNFLL